MQTEHNSNVERDFSREMTPKLVIRNFYWTNMERDIRNYCNEFNICQRTQAPRHAKPILLHPLELACMPWTHFDTDFITDLPESEEATMILVVVDRFTKMAHCIPKKIQHSQSVGRA